MKVAGAMSQVKIADPDPPPAPTQGAATATVKENAVCRSGPTADYEVQDTLKAGEVLTVQGRSQSGDAWVVFNPDIQETCWVEGMFVDVIGAMSQVEIANPDPPPAPTQGAATATVKENAVCRDGPTKEYKILAYFNAGTVLNIVGKNRAGNSWVVENPVNRRNCWIFGGLVDVIGDTGLVMIVNPDPPPTPTQKPEENPPFNCSQYNTNPGACSKEAACYWDQIVQPNACKNKP